MLRKIVRPQVTAQKPQVLKGLLLSSLSAILLLGSFPRFNIEIFAWFAFIPLFFALRNKSRIKAFLLSYLTGIIFWLGTVYWLIHVTLAGMILLVLYLALYFAFFGLIISRRSVLCTPYSALFIPSLWVVLEYLRSHLFTGFPWTLLGYSQYLNLAAIQIADLSGAWGVSFLLMMVNVLVYRVVSAVYSAVVFGKKQKKISSRITWVLPFLLVFLSLGYGLYKLDMGYHVQPGQRSLKISVVQGNIPQELKWSPGSEDSIIKKYMTLTTEVGKFRPDLIVWPEAAIPVVLEKDCELYATIKRFIKNIANPILLGAVTLESGQFYNSALLFSAQGKLLSKYNKLHLVPFGEYVPLKKIFSFLETVVPIGDFTAGDDYTIFKVPSTEYRVQSRNFAVLICFEDLFPELSRRFVREGADFLINITNDAWFKKTSSPYQHLQASVFRAVENRVPLVRSANTGISGFIAPSGKILSLLHDKMGRNIFISGFDSAEIAISQNLPTFYNRYGDIFVIICLLLILLGVAVYVKYYSSRDN